MTTRLLALLSWFAVAAGLCAGGVRAADPAGSPASPTGPAAVAAVAVTPNVVFIFTDDQGYGDLGCFGATDLKTPNLDRLAAAGTRFTSFYVAQAVCTASRAAVMTGCYPNRVGLHGALNHTSKTGIHPDELTLAEIFKRRGYATAAYGKWHLGSEPAFSPLRHGFDEFFGLPYSNDNGRKHPVIRDIPPLPLVDGDKVVEQEPDQSRFTEQFTERAVSFIARNRDKPFFLYLPHVMPHVPIAVSDRFKGRSARGFYGDVIEELDDGVGRVLAALTEHKLDGRTLVIFASDNGPFLSYGSHAGSAGPLREGKLTAFEGGVRTPCIVRWSGRVPAGRVCDEPLTMMDLVPTFAKLLGVDLPAGRIIDGKDVWPVVAGRRAAASPHEAIYFYAGDELHAVRAGRWKLHLPHPYLAVAGEPGRDGKPSNYGKQAPKPITQSGIEGIASRHGYRVAQQPLALYDLSADVGETTDLAAANPEVVKRLTAYAERAREDLGDALTGRKGRNLRPPGKVE